ncbi:MAG: hypothetical protein WCX07_05480 [Dehalococcoidales bacterium]|jgi:rubredoxin|nr:hypothetical protein [Dehalococcoidales bacterium]MDD3995069.1 hypothetical protein [Dehalococcoidales bacterium]NLT27642.1 hypothetical protein [Dehalococcoidales bacterium]
MNWWMCSECDYVLQAEVPPEKCPSCHKECIFSDVTCYIPECGGAGRLNMKMVAEKAKADKNKIN